MKIRLQRKQILASGLFNPDWYLERYFDVAEYVKDPLLHYLNNGVAEGYWPTSKFDPWGYLHQHNDVAQSGVDPFYHYICHGQSEGRWNMGKKGFEASKSLDVSKSFAVHPKNDVKNIQEWRMRFQKKFPQNDREIIILHPDWIGIQASASEFAEKEQLFFLQDIVTPDLAQRLAKELCSLKSTKIVFQGLAHSWSILAKTLDMMTSSCDMYCIFHGSFYQMGLEYDRMQLSTLLKLNRENIFKCIGFVKKGMAETIGKGGYNTHFIMNCVNTIPSHLELYPHGQIKKIGIWGREWDQCKPPYMALAACLHVNDVLPVVYGGDNASRDLLKILNMRGEVRPPVPQKSVYDTFSQMYINLYVTMSECAPLLPLESLSVGVPCIFSSNNHYFEDHDYLHDMLVVSQPDSEYAIAQKLQRVMEQRDKIIQEYILYAPGYIQRAKQSYQIFLEH